MGNHVPTSPPAIKTMEYFAGVLDGKLTELFNQLTGFQINASGNTAARATYDGEDEGFVYYDSQAGFLYQKQSATSADWSDGLQLVAAMQNLIDDTSPQAGGNIDLQGFLLVGNGGAEGIAIDVDGQVGFDGITSPQDSVHAPSATIGAYDSNAARLRVGKGATGDREASIEFGTDTTYTSGSMLITRAAGANGIGSLLHRGTGALQFTAQEAAEMVFSTTNTKRLGIEAGGNVAVGDITPACALDVDGIVRPKSYTVATVPSAVGVDGGMIYVWNETGGSIIAMSDGTNWLRLTDRTVISA